MRRSAPSRRAFAVAERVEDGVRALIAFAKVLSETQWQTRIPRDGRTIGVVVYHVASVYPLEIQLVQRLAAGHPVTGMTADDVNEGNATHAEMFAAVTKEVALSLLRYNAAAAATAIRALSDEQLDRAAPVSLYGDAPVTCQFLLEDRVLRHSYHHLARIRMALKAHDDVLAQLKCQLGDGPCYQR
jgi:hypothetical protein